MASAFNLPGTLSVDTLNLDSGTQLKWNLGSANILGGPSNDLAVVAGNLVQD